MVKEHRDKTSAKKKPVRLSSFGWDRFQYRFKDSQQAIQTDSRSTVITITVTFKIYNRKILYVVFFTELGFEMPPNVGRVFRPMLQAPLVETNILTSSNGLPDVPYDNYCPIREDNSLAIHNAAIEASEHGKVRERQTIEMCC